jgi:hypothetical protein
LTASRRDRARRIPSLCRSFSLAIDGEHRAGSYRVLPAILQAWGGISSKDGFVGRAPWLIAIGDSQGFLRWFRSHRPALLERNN